MAKKKYDIAPGKRPRHYLREWREYRGLTQIEVAQALGMSDSAVSKLENGHHGYTQATLESLARIYDTDIISLLARDPADPAGLWETWQKLQPRQRPQAVALIRALADTAPAADN